MLAWNDLPVASKKEVIKRLDLMSRTAMRCTSREHRAIVDATEFYVPRVRFSSNESSACLIMIYTGIEKFLRIEIDTLEYGIMVYRMENTYDRAEGTKHKILTIGSNTLSYKILKSLFAHDSVLLGALEIEFPLKLNAACQGMVVAYLHRELGGRRFRTKKLVTNCHTWKEPELMLYKNICVAEELEELRNEGFRLDTEQLECRKILDMVTLPDKKKSTTFMKQGDIPVEKYIHVPSYETHMWLAQMRLETPCMLTEKALEVSGFATVRFGLFPDEPDLWENQPFPIERVNEHVLMKRNVCERFNVTVRWNHSKCGTWVHMVRIDKEKKFLDFFKNEKCGLRWLCKKCTDPFEQWFYKELPRRVYYEPEWNFTALEFVEFTSEDSPVDELSKEMREQYAADEIKRAKNKKKTPAESWGFKTAEEPSGTKGSWLWSVFAGNSASKKAPPKFVAGEDFDDLRVFINDGKTLHVNMEQYNILSTEWTHYRPKGPSSAKKPSASDAEKLMAELQSMTVEDFCEMNGVSIRTIKDGKLPILGQVEMVDMAAVRKKIDSMPPLHTMMFPKLMDSGEDEKEEEDDGESVKELNRAEKKAEKNRKKKEKKKIRKQTGASVLEKGDQMV